MSTDAQSPLALVAILGLGLMGASLGMALRQAGVVEVGGLAGFDAAAGVARRARERGAIDRACDTMADAVTGARLVVLAAPVAASRELLRALRPDLDADAVVMDLGGTKSAVVAWAREILPQPSRFVPTHPMTGREQSGVDAAVPDLYTGCVWCVTSDADTAPSALALVSATIEALGARPLILTTASHDAAVATISHLPLLAAAALVLTAGESADWPLARQLAAGGFRDTTRVASGDPRMGRDICLTNREPILAGLDAYLAQLQRLRAAVAAEDVQIEQSLSAAKCIRDGWLGEQSPLSARESGRG